MSVNRLGENSRPSFPRSIPSSPPELPSLFQLPNLLLSTLNFFRFFAFPFGFRPNHRSQSPFQNTSYTNLLFPLSPTFKFIILVASAPFLEFITSRRVLFLFSPYFYSTLPSIRGTTFLTSAGSAEERLSFRAN